MAGWIAGIALALVLGMFVGKEVGASSERQAIANDCRYGGSFTLRKTGYVCQRLSTATTQTP
jgi:hypothetical protein